MESTSIFSENQWEKRYPATEYRDLKQPRRTQYCLHYLAALKQPVSSFKTYLQRKETADKRRALTSADSRNFGLTPIMVSVARGDVDVTRYLLEAAKDAGCLPCCLSQIDDRGFTVLHHAIFSAPPLVQELLGLGANADAKTHANCTYQDLEQLVDPNLDAVSSQNLAWNDGTGPVPYVGLTSEQREAIGITNYRDVPFYGNQRARYALWKSLGPLKPTNNAAIRASASAWTPPNLELKPCPELGDNQIGLFAGKNLPYGTILGPFAGEWTPAIPVYTFEETIQKYLSGETSHHQFQVQKKHILDGKNVGNAISRANHGFPVNTAEEYVHIKGRPPTAALAVIDPNGIKNGDEVRWSPGLNSALIWCDQKLIDRDQLHAFFRPGLPSVLQSMTKEKKHPAKFNFLCSNIMSVITMPKALIELHLSELVSADEWLQLLFSQSIGKTHSPISFDDLLNGPPNGPQAARNINVLLLVLNGLDHQMTQQGTKTALRQRILKWLLPQVDDRSVFHQVKALTDISNAISHGLITERSWPEFATTLETTLQNYDWFQDDASPLHGDNATFMNLGMMGPGIDFKKMWKDSLMENMRDNPRFTAESPVMKECISVAKKLGISTRDIELALARGIQARPNPKPNKG